MTLLAMHASVLPRRRGRRGVQKILRLVPRGEKHTLDWWIAHLRSNWEKGG